MPAISDRTWVAARLADGAGVTAIADEAGVSRQTAYTWLSRHQLEPASRRTPPEQAVLAAMYEQHRSARLVGQHLGVSSDTARRWLHAAGVTVGTRVDVDVDEARRQRRGGASLAEIARSQGVSAETIRRRMIE